MMNISLLVPTRGRPHNMKRLLQSVLKTVKVYNKVELIWGLDVDDEASIATAKEMAKNHTIVKYMLTPRLKMQGAYWNRLWDMSRKEIGWQGGDDIVFKSDNWDEIVRRNFDQYPDKIVLLYGRDGNQDKKLGTHSFLHRNWVDTVGYFVPEHFHLSLNDKWINGSLAALIL